MPALFGKHWLNRRTAAREDRRPRVCQRALRNPLSSVRIQNHNAIGPQLCKAEHLAHGAGDSVKRTLPDTLSPEPVILDKTDDRGLVGGRVIDKVLFRPR